MKKLPSLNHAVDLFKQMYSIILKDDKKNYFHMNIENNEERKVLIMVSLDADIEHAFVASESINKLRKKREKITTVT